MSKWVVPFQDGRADQKELLGGKGANLAEMSSLGLPVPPGFIITTAACIAYLEAGGQLPDGLWDQVHKQVKVLESEIGKEFGSASNPLLVSVRSGAAVSMPGMMDTILNLGLNDDTVHGLANAADPRFAFDCYRRLIQMYGNVVIGLNPEPFEDALDEQKRQASVFNDNELPADILENLVRDYKQIYAQKAGHEFPQDPEVQLELATKAVFDSWNNQRAINYRRQNDIPGNLGTAVNVQAMVFGNMGDDCATGVGFTRDPSTGDKGMYGEYLPNAQGEDVVAGVRTPRPIVAMGDDPLLKNAYDQLLDIGSTLEAHYRDMQDVEFTVERGKLYMLQTRTGKRTGMAAINIAVDMVEEELISKPVAVSRIEPQQLDQILHPMIDPDANVDLLSTGLPASPGAASGQIVFNADDAKARGDAGEKVILVRRETSPDDFHGMVAAQGVLTARGGMTSHAAVVARGMGKPCVAGADELEVDYQAGTLMVDGRTLSEGDFITIDGATGRIMAGEVPTIDPQVGGNVSILLSWADDIRRLGVRANADTGEDATVAREFGAEGIGLCRTEHMFFGDERLFAMRNMILSETEKERRKSLEALQVMQQSDFAAIFRAMDGQPVTIRTLDPPLHEFLPHNQEEIAELATELGLSARQVESRVAALHEANPMLGHRGCRLGITFPEITEMQARAIFTAAAECIGDGVDVIVEIMVPLVADVNELRRQRALIVHVASEVEEVTGKSIPYHVGTMIELPRAALTADEIAEEADFFSFGTNDLTQTTYGLSRDDSGRFLPLYVEREIFDRDPFVSIDPKGVGRLIEIACEAGRSVREDLKLGICGEHGGDPFSVDFCHRAGLDYVSCSPFRVPIARLAAAHAAIRESGD